MVRISGREALVVADRVLRLAKGMPLSFLPPRTVYYGRVVDAEGREIDEVLSFYFRGPKSYTGEDLVEIQAHGGPVILRRILAAVLAAGAVLAEPGEFTARAVYNGRINLIQAEAVLDLIRAKTDVAAEAAFHRLAGEAGREITALEEELLGLLAAIEGWLDFPEEVEAPPEVAARARTILARFDALLAGAERGRLLNEGAAVAIVGRPNAGKSSLLNALLGEERAIVTEIPGTTRDAVAEECNLGGIPVRLVDTAGLGPPGDRLEALGMERSRREIARADAVLFVLDGSEELTAADEAVGAEVAGCRGVVAINKSDLPLKLQGVPSTVLGWPVVRVSALTQSGLDGLVTALMEVLGGRPGEGTPALSNLRQIEAAREARRAVAAFLEGLARGVPWDFLAAELRAALTAIGRLSGRTVTSAVIDEIFTRFCLGK
ncbi:MAG: tRNA uridine-5-carboxymethylaminomethyl(34) synthesis GTPase MnmE [Firmicutes bacterium]|nr:tRNA uridine-5-carboxymethylaminomethyl(34) synthesis GTPase MnmE [Bacillota bacterium]